MWKMWKCEYVNMWFNNMVRKLYACVVKRVAGVQE